MADYNTPENNNESFVRWQQKTLEERGKTINLFLGMSFATVGFVITQLMKNDFKFKTSCVEKLLGFGTSILLLAIVALIWLVLNRLKGFRITTQLAKSSHIKENGEIDILRKKSKKIDSSTHTLFTVSLVLFGIAETLVVIGFILQVWDKF